MPRATINIGDAAGQTATNATWKYAIGFVPGQENEGLVANGEGSPCRLPGYDDSGWETCQDLSVGISSGFTFAWYRTTITIPETVNGRPTNGMRVQFETCVDDYGEIWIDGECNRDRGTVQGFNVAQRVQVSSDATPGAQHTIAILAANGPAGRAVWDRVRALCQPWLRVDRVLRPGALGYLTATSRLWSEASWIESMNRCSRTASSKSG